jgi:hypothetical protein
VTEKRSYHWSGGILGFFQPKTASNGGITKQKLSFYPAEYVWWYNHRNDSDTIRWGDSYSC